jgi:hypothetical protein
LQLKEFFLAMLLLFIRRSRILLVHQVVLGYACMLGC